MRRILFLFALIILAAVCPVHALGATYYVSSATGVDDAADHTSWAHPALTPNHIFSTVDLAAGDVIELDGGASGLSYASGSTAILNVGTNDGGVIIRSSSDSGHNGTVTIDGATTGVHGYYAAATVDGAVTLQGLTIVASGAKSCIFAQQSTTVSNSVINGAGCTSAYPTRSEGAGVVTTYNTCTISSGNFGASLYNASGGSVAANNCTLGATGGVQVINATGGGSITVVGGTIDASGSCATSPVISSGSGTVVTIRNASISNINSAVGFYAHTSGAINLYYNIVKGYAGTTNTSVLCTGLSAAGNTGTINSANNIYSDVRMRYIATNHGTINSANDIWIGAQSEVSATSAFLTNNADATINLTNSLYTQGPRQAMGTGAVHSGTGTFTESSNIANVSPKFLKYRHQPATITITADSSIKTYCDAIAAVGATYSIPISYAMYVSETQTEFGPANANIISGINAITAQGHEVIGHTYYHPSLASTYMMTVTRSSEGSPADPYLTVTGTYPSLTLKLYDDYNGGEGTPVLTVDLTATTPTDYTRADNVCTAIGAVSGWSCTIPSGVVGDATYLTGPTKTKALKVANTSCPATVATTIPLEPENFWTAEITDATTWWESLFGTGYVTAMAYPFGQNTNYTADLITWLVANEATTKILGSRAFMTSEYASPALSMKSTSIPIFGTGTTKTIYVMSSGKDVTSEAEIRGNTRAWVEWLLTTDNVGVMTIHEAEASATDLGYMFSELALARAEGLVRIVKYSDFVSEIRSTYTDAGGGTYTKTFTDASDFRLRPSSSCINAGANICTGTDAPLAGCTGSGTGRYLDHSGRSVPVGSAPDIGPYEYKGSAVHLIATGF